MYDLSSELGAPSEWQLNAWQGSVHGFSLCSLKPNCCHFTQITSIDSKAGQVDIWCLPPYVPYSRKSGWISSNLFVKTLKSVSDFAFCEPKKSLTLAQYAWRDEAKSPPLIKGNTWAVNCELLKNLISNSTAIQKKPNKPTSLEFGQPRGTTAKSSRSRIEFETLDRSFGFYNNKGMCQNLTLIHKGNLSGRLTFGCVVEQKSSPNGRVSSTRWSPQALTEENSVLFCKPHKNNISSAYLSYSPFKWAVGSVGDASITAEHSFIDCSDIPTMQANSASPSAVINNWLLTASAISVAILSLL